jgi:hypothetical protein
LRDLRVSRLWGLASILPVVLAIWLDRENLRIASGLVLLVAFVAQLVIVLIKPPFDTEPIKVVDSDGPQE